MFLITINGFLTKKSRNEHIQYIRICFIFIYFFILFDNYCLFTIFILCLLSKIFKHFKLTTFLLVFCCFRLFRFCSFYILFNPLNKIKNVLKFEETLKTTGKWNEMFNLLEQYNVTFCYQSKIWKHLITTSIEKH